MVEPHTNTQTRIHTNHHKTEKEREARRTDWGMDTHRESESEIEREKMSGKWPTQCENIYIYL